MLPLPETDPTSPETLAGWVELSVLAEDDGQVSLGDIAEELRDSNLLVDSSADRMGELDGEPDRLAEQLAADVWSVIEDRRRIIGPSCPFVVERRLVKRRERRKKLSNVAGHLSMLLVEAAGRKWYSELSLLSGDEIRTNFELIAAASIEGLGNTRVERLGAPFPGQDVKGFCARVRNLVRTFALEPNERELERFTHPHEKDRGLDLVVRWWNDDPSGGIPYLLVQCATGKEWVYEKAAEPPMVAWRKFATWDGPTLKTIAVPYTVGRPRGLGDAWLRTEDSIIFDRLRLSRGNPDARLESKTATALAAWCAKQIGKLSTKQS